jgi:hypothetical protein
VGQAGPRDEAAKSGRVTSGFWFVVSSQERREFAAFFFRRSL